MQLFYEAGTIIIPILQERKLRPMKEVTEPMLHSQKVAEVGFQLDSKAGLLTTHGMTIGTPCGLLPPPTFSSPRGLATATDRLLSPAPS